MTKERRGVSLEPEVNEYLSQEGVNASQKINKLVKQEMNAGTTERAMLQLRLEQVRGDISNHEGELERLRKQEQDLLERLETLEHEREQQQENTLQDAINSFDVVELSSMDSPMVDATDDELQDYADELDMSIQELKDKIIAGAE
jgi:uncharacterized protein (DUF3084 family)